MDCVRILASSAIALLLFGVCPLKAQYGDPAAREDEAIERQKILKASDQIELLVQQNQKLQEDLAKVHQQLSLLQDEKNALLRRMDELEKNSAKDKQALLKEVANIVASKSGGSSSSQGQSKSTADTGAEKTTRSADMQGYEYVVKNGDSLWAIAKAYQDAGVKVSVEEIRKANSMDKSQDIRAGQKLFIPKN